jgi:hypothetical protein
MTTTHARLIAAALALRSDLDAATISQLAWRAVALLSVIDGEEEHEEPDPTVPPVCRCHTATIWFNMPEEWIPKGALIRHGTGPRRP